MNVFLSSVMTIRGSQTSVKQRLELVAVALRRHLLLATSTPTVTPQRKMIRTYCRISAEGEKLLENAVTHLGLSARRHDRILKVSRTIADLDSADEISLPELA
jgi:magnesium chelatase family protein